MRRRGFAIFQKLSRKYRDYRMSIRLKLTLGLGAIAVTLLLSSIISVLEYRRMSNYLSDLIAANIKSINVAQKLGDLNEEYNLRILAAIGDSSAVSLPESELKSYISRCDSLRMSIMLEEATPWADSLAYSYSAFMLTSMELENVINSDFINSRDWYFSRLQPRYHRLREDIERINEVIYTDLKENSMTFQDGFYRSIIPGVVAVGAGLVLVLLLLFFMIVYYVNPLYRMLAGLDSYRNTGQRYRCIFEGNDQLASLNEGITEIVEDNIDLKRRNKVLRDAVDSEIETDRQ